MPTVLNLLEAWVMNSFETEGRSAVKADRSELEKDFLDLLVVLGYAVAKIATSAPSLGYEPYLIEQGCGNFSARGLAALLRRHGKRVATDSAQLTRVAKAIRFVSKPAQYRKSLLRNIQIILDVWHNTSILEGIFIERDDDVFEFVRALEGAAADKERDILRAREIAHTLLGDLSVSRGPKISAESAAHEYFLRELVPYVDRERAYTWTDRDDAYKALVTIEPPSYPRLRYPSEVFGAAPNSSVTRHSSLNAS